MRYVNKDIYPVIKRAFPLPKVLQVYKSVLCNSAMKWGHNKKDLYPSQIFENVYNGNLPSYNRRNSVILFEQKVNSSCLRRISEIVACYVTV